MRKLLTRSLIISLAILLTACSSFIYKPDIQQGNIFTQEKIDKLRPGMTKTQVLYVLGSPVLEDIFARNRWDYVYTFQHDGGNIQIKRVSLIFQDNILQQIDNTLPISHR